MSTTAVETCCAITKQGHPCSHESRKLMCYDGAWVRVCTKHEKAIHDGSDVRFPHLVSDIIRSLREAAN